MIKNYEYITSYKNYYIYKGLRYYCISKIKSDYFNSSMINYDYFIDLDDVKKFIDEML